MPSRPLLSRAVRPRSRAVHRRRLGAALVLASLGPGVLVGSVAAVAGAQEPPGAGGATSLPVTWGVRPAPSEGAATRPNFEFDAAPGESVADELVVENPSAVNLVLGVYASDAFNTPGGGTDLLAADEDLVDVGRWTTPEQTSITVPAGGSVTVPFTVTVPEDAEPGDHVGGIVTSLTVSEPNAQGDRIDVERRLGSRIYVRVDGGVEPALTYTQLEVDHHGSWNPFAAGSLTVRYSVENTGNVRLRATRLVRVTPRIGAALTSEAADMAELLPGNSYEFTQEVAGVWPGLSTDVQVELEPYTTSGATLDPAPAPTVARTEVSLWPVPQVVAVVVALLGVCSLLWRRHRTRAARSASTGPAAAPSATPPPFPHSLSSDQLGSTQGQLYKGDAP